MKNLFLTTLLICLTPITSFAEEPADASEKSYEIIVGVTTCQDVLEHFGRPLFTTKTEEGNQVWVYSKVIVESISDDSVPEQKGFFLIEFDREDLVSNYQIMTTDEVLSFKKERGCGPLIGDKEWFSWSEDVKLEMVKGFIQIAGKNGIIIRQPPEYYLKEVETILSGPLNPDKIPVGIAIKTIAVMDGDWDDGSGDKLGIAREHLGYELYGAKYSDYTFWPGRRRPQNRSSGAHKK